MAMGRILCRQPELVADDTEIRIVTFGCEEAGMRGSRRYVAAHREELTAARARLFNIETVAHPIINIMRSDFNGMVKHSPAMVDSLVAASAKAEVPYRVRPFPFGGGGTDAGPFSRAGIEAACVLQLRYPQQIIHFYHQPADNCSVLSIEPFENTLAMATAWVELQRD